MASDFTQAIYALGQLLLFILPAYLANSAPVLFGGGTPIDFKKSFFDKKRIFGEGKTFKGFFAGVLAGTVAGTAIALPFNVYGLELGEKAAIALLLSVGTMIGDLVGSFLKRRQGLKRGEESFLADQLLFLVFALAFAFSYKPSLISEIGAPLLAILFFATFFLHKFFNVVAHWLELKKVPW